MLGMLMSFILASCLAAYIAKHSAARLVCAANMGDQMGPALGLAHSSLCNGPWCLEVPMWRCV